LRCRYGYTQQNLKYMILKAVILHSMGPRLSRCDA
jgi:hypothetical protein